MKRALSLAAILKPLARWREEAFGLLRSDIESLRSLGQTRARVERDAAFEAWLMKSGLQFNQTPSAEEQEREPRQERSSA